jgi:enoyl-[acyl-carrier protein] reductase III
MSRKRFQGKIAFVTGGSKGLGKAIALRLASEGCNVAIGFLTGRDDARETVEQIERSGVRGLALRGNIANEDHMRRMFDTLASDLGGLDFFISNAAAGALKPAIELTDKDWQLSMDAIARALLVGAQLAVPLMEKRGGGKIVGMASMGAARVMKHYSAIGTAKAAMENLIRYLGMELIEKNINVNAVSAGVTDTRSLSLFPNRDEMVEYARKFTPSGKLTDPADVAAVVAFLCSEDARWIVGQTIIVDGGLTLRS